MTETKIWQIKGRPNSLKLSEEELIEALKNDLIEADDVLVSNELDREVMVKDTIYAFYLKGINDEEDKI